MISPATDREAMKSRSTEPIIRPMKISRTTCRAMVASSTGGAGATGMTTGVRTRVSRKAKDRRMGTGTAWSPIPGMVMTMAAIRVKTIAPA